MGSESVPNKKKKTKAEKENLEVTVDQTPESTETVAVEKSAKKEKKKEKKKLKKSQDSTSKITNGEDGIKKDARSVARTSKQRLQADHDYIVSFLDAMHIPNHKKDDDEEDEFEEDQEGSETKEEKEKRVKPGATSRAASSQELRDRLQARLEELRGRKLGVFESKRQKKLKRKLASIEKKKLADQDMKQKLMTIGKNAGNLNKV